MVLYDPDVRWNSTAQQVSDQVAHRIIAAVGITDADDH